MAELQRLLVTGGAGFIGGAVVRHLLASGYDVINVDKLTYAGDPRSLRSVEELSGYRFHQADVCDEAAIAAILAAERPDAIMHLAAETHVDRSIDGPEAFVDTNIVGTFRLLGAALQYWRGLPADRRSGFRFHHVSTDEVFGSLDVGEAPFSETRQYAPSSPYSASKAAADHLVRAWGLTYGLPVVLSNCSNNYGPFQFPEKLIALGIINAIEGRPIPVYGAGENVRDWLYVDDHARALELVVKSGRAGESYNVGGNAERTNHAVIALICDILDRLRPREKGRSHHELITFVGDRPGHDLRYAMDCSRIAGEFDWKPVESFESGLEKTVRWYLDNEWWWREIRAHGYGGERLGAAE